MRKLSLLTDLNAFDPLPALGAKIDKTPKPAVLDPLLAIHDFERTPHELSSHRPGPAGKGAAIGSDGAAVARTKQPREDFFGSFVPDGDKRHPGESGGWYCYAGGHAAGDQADSGDTRGGQSSLSENDKKYFATLLESQARQTGRASVAGHALTVAPWAQGLSAAQLWQVYDRQRQRLNRTDDRLRLWAEYNLALRFAHP